VRVGRIGWTDRFAAVVRGSGGEWATEITSALTDVEFVFAEMGKRLEAGHDESAIRRPVCEEMDPG